MSRKTNPKHQAIYVCRKLLTALFAISLVYFFASLNSFARPNLNLLLEFTGYFKPVLVYIGMGFITFACLALPFFCCEIILPGSNDRLNFRKNYITPALIVFSYYIASCLVVFLIAYFKKKTDFIFWSDFVPYSAPNNLLIYIVLIDFLGYWFHRLEHASPLLWKFHSTHHSIRNINSINQYVHWTQPLFRFIFVAAPIAIILPTPDYNASILVTIWFAWTHYTHSSSPALTLPRTARFVLVDNLFHHYHHGIDGKYKDINFGTFFSIWDIIFGTARLPKNNKFPETGLIGTAPPSNLVNFVMHPYRSGDNESLRNPSNTKSV